MKRYYLIAGYVDVGYFGWEGFQGSFSEVEEALAQKDRGDPRKKGEAWKWWHVVDSYTGLYVAHSATKDAAQLLKINEPLTARVAA